MARGHRIMWTLNTQTHTQHSVTMIIVRRVSIPYWENGMEPWSMNNRSECGIVRTVAIFRISPVVEWVCVCFTGISMHAVSVEFEVFIMHSRRTPLGTKLVCMIHQLCGKINFARWKIRNGSANYRWQRLFSERAMHYLDTTPDCRLRHP